MSYQSSIHFDPTALLIIKNEIDNSIKLVENAVSTLAEEQTLPFGIDDALNQFEQCARILAMIDMPRLALITDYSASLMRKIMSEPHNIQTQDVIALSEGTTMLKRYIEFICLREVRVPQFLIDTLNRLELALGKPQTREGAQILPLLDCFQPNFNLAATPELEKSAYVHQLYKLSLRKLLQHTAQSLDFQAIKIVGVYLASFAQNTPSQQYWELVNIALDYLDHLILNQARLRVFIQLETNIGQFLQHPENFTATSADLADILSLCISQEDEISEHIRQQLNMGDEQLSDTQLEVLSRHLYGPDYTTIHTASKLITDAMTQIRHDIEYNYQNMSTEKIQELQTSLKNLANVFKVLNLNEAYQELYRQSEALNQPTILNDENYAQQLMKSILAAMNSIGILERNYLSSRLQLRVNNMNISLDRLDEAHQVLLTESKALIEMVIQMLLQYEQQPEAALLEPLCVHLKELSGAALFLGSKEQQLALLNTAEFVHSKNEQQQTLNLEQICLILNVLASLDMLIDNLKNKQPVLQSMFDVALENSQKLQTAAA
ncbi:chemotaxis protein [Acinetobacter ursingii]|uniref:chemotaxis protein n=1 Tax=Acinetobacter ursingii TaxID=108980 RepID=UPI0021CD59DF|nr:chemotaxis protein [Acinetobacter ursingii]MCU4483681.1 chemotaxis protein [Acinetobacter ursingii]MCU4507995.1 chemotaxis protein [Acinetobacter ursingii]MCU4571021.1 chemotaxis protein [Acinetobacter ursingii]